MRSTAESKSTRLDKAALFRMLAYVPHRGQQLVHDCAARIRAIAAGSRWGKSRCAVMETLAFSLQPGPSARAWICAPRFEIIDMLLELLLAQLRGGLAHRLLEVDRRARRVVIQNLAGHSVIVEGRCTTNVGSLLGEALDFLLVDESGRVADEAWESALSQRLVERNGRALIVGTPRGEGSWFHELHKRGQGADADIESWSGKTVDNPSINAELVERERSRLSAAEFASEYEGLFVGPDGPLCDVCGGPNRSGVTSVILPFGETLQHCGACSRPLGRDGRPVGVAHQGGTYVLVLTTDEVDPPEGA
jgi:hypothetical protein